MKVLVLTNLYPPDFIGGYELGCCQMTEALRGRGHDVRVVTSAPRTPVPSVPHVCRRFKLSDTYNDYLIAHSTPVTRQLIATEGQLVNAYNVHTLLDVLEEFQPDVAYLWLLVGLGGLGLVSCLHHLRIPWVWHLMDKVPVMLCGYGQETIPALGRQFQRQLRGHYLACSRRVIEEIDFCGIQLNGTIEIIPNWVAGPRRPSRKTYLADGKLRIISAGQVGRHKGIDRLIAAAGLLRERGHQDFAVDIYGKVTDPSFEMQVSRLRLTDHVSLMGSRTQAELAELYGQYDVFAFPTWEREPFAFAPLEAAAFGCVPVMSKVSGNSEWLVHDVHCLKADRTAEAFAGVFQDILQDRIDLQSLGRRAAHVVSRDFHIDTLAGRVERALSQAAQQPRSGAGTPAEAYHLAVLAEKLAQVLVQEEACA